MERTGMSCLGGQTKMFHVYSTMHKRIPLQYNFMFPFTVGGHSYLRGVAGAMAGPLSVGSQPGDWGGSVCRVHQVRSRQS